MGHDDFRIKEEEHAEFGKLIGEFETTLSDVIFRRVIGSVVPIALLGLFIGIELSRDYPFEVINTGMVVMFSIPLIWIACRLFLRKMYNAKVYESGLIITNKTRNKAREINFHELEFIDSIVRTIWIEFLPIWRYRTVRIAFEDEPGRGIVNFLKAFKTAWALEITKANMANLEQFGDALTEIFNNAHGHVDEED